MKRLVEQQVKIRQGAAVIDGWMPLDNFLINDLSVRDLMDGGEFGGELSPEEEEAAHAECMQRQEAHGIPCPRL
jgi:hypothetical protein